jgi:protoporphyrinogen IX oxidase
MYEWTKVLHIFAVIAWMAGLFYLPRLFVYHAGKAQGSEVDETFKVMERRLCNAIMRPAAFVSVVSGVGLVLAAGYSFGELWVLAKLVCVALMVGFHGFLEVCLGQFRRGENMRSGRFFRIANEVPTVLLGLILVFVVVKPFS